MKVKAFGILLSFVLLCLLLNTTHVHAQEAQKKIVEHVSVNWWQVPVFAVNSSGKPITDLKAEDIEVYVNGQRVEDFVFYKRAFSVTLAKEETIEESKAEKPPVMKQNAIFLLFDQALSTGVCIERSKEVAKQIIQSASPDIRFIVASILPFEGLHYIYGPTNDKTKLLEKLEQEIDPKVNARLVDSTIFFEGPRAALKILPKTSGGRAKYTEKELKQFKQFSGNYYMRKNTSFFYAFDSIYLLFNALDDNKFVYFFSEGLSNDIRASTSGGASMYNKFLRKAANRMGRSGAVLFIVNPMGVVNDTNISDVQEVKQEPGKAPVNRILKIDGEDSLRYLAKESGGKYIEGVNTKIVKTLENMHRAYYEISFSDVPGIKGDTRGVSIKMKRKGVRIHTLRSLEKSKKYAQMERMEQEIFVLNLVSQNRMLKKLIPFEHARVTGLRTVETAVTYSVKLPKNFLRQNLDLYKFWVKNPGIEGQMVVHMEKQALYPRKQKITIQCATVDEKTRGTTPYFALIDSKNNKALLRVIGDSWIDDDTDEEKARLAKKKKKKSTISPEELNRILTGAAQYCDKLEESAFHFLCKEEIADTRRPLSKKLADPQAANVGGPSNAAGKPNYSMKFKRTMSSKKPKTTVNKFTFSYRLMKNGESIKEERQWMTAQKDRPLEVDKNQVSRDLAFFSERVIFAPATMLANGRQELYRFTFEGYDTLKGRRCAMIRGIPLDPHFTRGFFGTVWIDTEDYSVLKASADPRTLSAYSRMKQLAVYLKTRLNLSIEAVFDLQHEGIRFPTRVSMLEKYKGGRNISKIRGPAGWERTHTVFRYSDYRFFSVKTDVIVSE